MGRPWPESPWMPDLVRREAVAAVCGGRHRPSQALASEMPRPRHPQASGRQALAHSAGPNCPKQAGWLWGGWQARGSTALDLEA